MQRLHYVTKIENEYAVCGAPVGWASTSAKVVTCEGCLQALRRLTPLAPDRAITDDGDETGDTRAAGEAC